MNVYLYSQKDFVLTAQKNKMIYIPQGLLPYGKRVKGEKRGIADMLGHRFSRPSHKKSYVQEYTNYPSQIIEFASESKPTHPTQKPTALIEYLIKTYSNEGETILDNCMGSGTTAVACINTNRKFIGIELDENYYNIACKRVEETMNNKQLNLF